MYADFAKQGTVVALGSFDGLHLGHMAVINEAKNMATRLDAKPILCTFFEHPKKVLTGEAPPALFTGEVREQAFRDSGVEVVKLDFASIMDMSPEEFFGEILIKKFNAKGVCCGFNYTFGAKGAGDSELLEKFCREAGMGFSASPATMLDGEVISSSRIRHALEEGNVELAERMLGRPFHYCTRVIDGDKRGRTWGIPTINQKYETELVIPRFGVYLSRCTSIMAPRTSVSAQPSRRGRPSPARRSFWTIPVTSTRSLWTWPSCVSSVQSRNLIPWMNWRSK